MIKSSAVRLQRDFDGIFGVETIERFVADSFATARARPHLRLRAGDGPNRFTRDWLRAVAKSDRRIASDRPTVFSCACTTPAARRWPPGWMRHPE